MCISTKRYAHLNLLLSSFGKNITIGLKFYYGGFELTHETNQEKRKHPSFFNDADWVDYKTFKGSQGTHDTKYDSFYEMKIPFSALGIDKNYLETNGIGAMLVATRGESGIDCIPYDDTMLDNTTGEYSSDASTSAEKDDIDVITSEFARIGKSGVNPTQPTTAKPTTVSPTTQPTTAQPTTVSPTTRPTAATYPVSEGKVEVTSNLFTGTQTYNESNTFTVDFDLESAMKIVNGQWKLTYDSNYLSIRNVDGLMPYISSGAMINAEEGAVYGAFSNVNNLYNFTSKKAMVSVTFDVKKKFDKTVNVNLELQELSVGYSQNGVTKYANVVKNGIYRDVTSQTGFSNAKPKFTTDLYVSDILYGDVNNDGNVTVDDVTLLQLYVAGDKSLDANAQLKADVNRDGIIDILDCTEIQLYVAGNIPNLG